MASKTKDVARSKIFQKEGKLTFDFRRKIVDAPGPGPRLVPVVKYFRFAAPI